jgi:hypothetical protein
VEYMTANMPAAPNRKPAMPLPFTTRTALKAGPSPPAGPG